MKAADQRRHQRVHFRRDFGSNDRIVKARAIWPNLEASDVYDLSFGGMAIAKPGLFEFSNDQSVSLSLELGEQPAFLVQCKVAWVQNFTVGFSFMEMSADGLASLRKFLSDKLVGANLSLVNKESYPKDGGFDFWFSGPRSSHIFITLGEAKEFPIPIRAVEIDMNGKRLRIEDNKIQSGDLPITSVIQVLSHAPEKYVELYQVLELLSKVLVFTRLKANV